MFTRQSPGLGSHALMAGIQAAANEAFTLLFPPRCLACDRIGQLLCADCAQRALPITQPHCARCGRLRQHAVDQCDECRARGDRGIASAPRAATLHRGMIRAAIHAFKYDNRPELAPLLARYLVAVFGQAPWDDYRAQIDLVLPVPLHAERLAQRGYNQSALLATAFAGCVGLAIDERLLLRRRATESQVGKNAAERRANVAGAFTAGTVTGRTVLLIDDVLTTGATLNAAADALLDAGARAVCGLTLALPVPEEQQGAIVPKLR